MLTLAMPQSEPSADRKTFGLLLVAGEDRWTTGPAGRRCAARWPRRTCRRSARRGSGRRSPPGRPSLCAGIADDRRARRRRLRPRRRPAALAAGEDLAALGLGPVQRAPASPRAPGRDQRADESRLVEGVADGQLAVRGGRAARAESSATSRCTMSRRSVVQRWPAVPAAANTMPWTARSRSADGATMAALLPPSSSRLRPNRAATRGPTSRPIRVEPVALTSATRGSSTSCSPTVRSPSSEPVHVARARRPRRRPGRAACRRPRGDQRSELRRLPDDGVAADQGDGGVPRPHGGREVEGGDHADDAERVPGLGEPVAGTLGGDRPPVQLAGQTRRRSRRCRSSPGPRPAPRSGSCPPRW